MIENGMEVSDTESPKAGICPVTGLDVLHYPEWRDNTSEVPRTLRISIIARKIIHIQSSGSPTLATLRQGLQRIERIRARHIPAHESFAVIEDLSRLGNVPTEVKKQYANHIRSVPHVVAVILHSASSLQRFMIRLAKLIQMFPFPLLVAQDYPHAVQKALEALGESSATVSSPALTPAAPPARPRILPNDTDMLTGTRWRVQDASFTMEFQVINRGILHGVSTGFLEERHIPGIEAMRERVRRETRGQSGFDYFIADVTRLEGCNWKARKRFLQSIQAWHEIHPFKAFLLYGANRFLRIGIILARRIMPFNVLTAENLREALQIVQALESKASMEVPPLSDHRSFREKSAPDLQNFVDEILDHLARFSWDTHDPTPFEAMRPDHPFKPVFEAMDLLNWELRDLLQERRKTEAAILDSETKYRLITEQTSEFISLITFDENPRFTYISPSHRRLGYEPEELVGKPSLDFIHPEDQERLIRLLMESLVQFQNDNSVFEKTTETIEYRFRDKTGEWFDIEATANLIKDQVLFVSRDITERKRAQAALEASHAQLDATLNALPDLLLEVDSDGMILAFRVPGQDYLDLLPEGLCGKSLRSVFSEEATRTILSSLDRARTSGRQQGGVFFLDRPRGSYWIEFSAAAKKSAGSHNTSFIMLCRDITQRRRSEFALRQSEERYRQLMDSAQDMIVTLDLTGRPTMINAATLKVFGYSLEEVLTMNIRDILPPETWPILAESLVKRQAGDDFRGQYEIDIIARGGERIPVEGNSVLLTENDRPSGVLIIARDISDRRRAEQERLRMENRLRVAQKLESVGLLAGGIAHDFNNVLTGIQGYASLMQLNVEPAHPDQSRIKAIESLVSRASELTRQLLGFARGGKYEVKPTRLDELIRGTADMFGRTRKEIRIHHDHSPGLWLVAADQGQMNQVMMNLFVNAALAMPNGGDMFLKTQNVVIDDTQADRLSIRAGNTVRITVADTGVGMDSAILSKIFDPFFTTRETGKGSGLGLASAYGIIKNHDGVIDVESEPGRGTRFVMTLPALPDQPVAQPPPSSLPEIHGTGTILLIDDEDMVREVAGMMLEHLGFTVITASSGREAVQIYLQKEDDIDLILLDMIMPEMTGSQTFDRLKDINPEVRVLLTSGYSVDGQAADILRRGCRGFIQKPFRVDALSRKIQDALNQITTSREVSESVSNRGFIGES
ncbi:MAG: PAS domain S-box protein [Deltaproteobacteria bacterium]|nr:PAS domain S-box protein [Deltaproteobacteria bacterium]